MIHTYSLIHDDLPALDDDEWRRGVPTCHKKFGEATAILAGDALLTDGLRCFTLFPADAKFDSAKIRAANAVAEAIGTRGMIGGQVEDIEAERERPAGERSLARLEKIHANKTESSSAPRSPSAAFFRSRPARTSLCWIDTARTSVSRFRSRTISSTWSRRGRNWGRRPGRTRPTGR